MNRDVEDFSQAEKREDPRPKKRKKRGGYIDKPVRLKKKQPQEENENKEPEVLDARQMIRKIQEMHEEIESKLEFIEKNKEFLPKEVLDAVASPEKVVHDHHQMIAKLEASLDEQLMAILGKSAYLGYKKKAKKSAKRTYVIQKLRAKKKWLPM